MLTTDQPRYQVKIHLDHDVEDPTNYGLFKIVSFNSRHYNHGDKAYWLACQWEPDDPEHELYGYICDRWPNEKHMDHEHVLHPDYIATLSYYEHGLCKWMVGSSTVPDYGGFDTVGVAGVIAWKDQKSKQEYHEWMSNAEKLSYERYKERLAEVLDAVVEEYTAWCNGETYWFEVLEWDPEEEDYSIDVDSCGGYIGDYVKDAALECLDVKDPKEGVDYEIKEEWY